ncbi:MAG: tRNA (adenosine(37)-N6)-threonylcarbamoyltransferase complex transferase subunit TsaD [Erysipelotrichaceae bacterium]
MKLTNILAIESSCDETAVAIISNGKTIVSSIVATQIAVHEKYGGVIPEVASRIHVENISIVISEALEKANMNIESMDAIAVTQGPGLIGSLHVGITAAKALAWSYGLPLVPLHHIAGHIYANNLVGDLTFPLLALVVSGGHTELVYMKEHFHFEVVSQTQDDAIGEAYDKVARVMGLPYPGGPQIDRLAKTGNAIYTLPKPKMQNPMDFSFSGLKSGVLQFIDRMKRKNELFEPADLAASFQEVALGQLMDKLSLALESYDVKQVVLAGGVAANSRLRTLVEEKMQQEYPQLSYIIPPLSCCTDNAAMMGVVGYYAFEKGVRAGMDLGANPGLDLDAFQSNM